MRFGSCEHNFFVDNENASVDALISINEKPNVFDFFDSFCELYLLRDGET